MECRTTELSLLLTDDDEISVLNAQYRNKPVPTDVLSFSLREGDYAEYCQNVLGDIVISVATAARNATLRDESLRNEIVRLLIHGLLHLVGCEHEGVSKSIANKMKREERRLYEVVKSVR